MQNLLFLYSNSYFFINSYFLFLTFEGVLTNSKSDRRQNVFFFFIENLLTLSFRRMLVFFVVFVPIVQLDP